LRVRHRVGVGLASPINVYDACQKLGIDVLFANIPSMEGALARTPRPCVVVSSVRPPGRQAFTCAHELGHFVFEHAATVDLKADSELDFEQSNDEEQIADQFAAFLLMPKTAVLGAFRSRGLAPHDCPFLDILSIAGWFGVGYMTFANHLRFGLDLIDDARWRVLKKQRPAKIRADFVPQRDLPGLHVVDPHWGPVAIEARIGDGIWFASPPADIAFGQVIRHRGGGLVVAERTGTFGVAAEGLGAFQVRVARAQYEGRAIFRALAEDEGA
jgi:hypothetical protein